MHDTRGTEGAVYSLRQPGSAAEWESYHAIRRSVHFEDDAAAGADDLRDDVGGDPGAGPKDDDGYGLLLWCDGRPVGTIQVDPLDDATAALRLVAIAPEEQGHGHGRAMMREAEGFARAIGCSKAVVYATPEAAGFYDALGYAEDPFDDNYFGGVVQMTKALHYAGFSAEDEADGAGGGG